MRFQYLATSTLLTLLPLLQGCSDIKKTMGLERTPPNEFTVAPTDRTLSMPPHIDLLPPKPGQAPLAIQEKEAKKKHMHRNAMQSSAPLSEGEKALLIQGGVSVEEDIRLKVDNDIHHDKGEKSLLNRLGVKKKTADKGKAIDPFEESKKLKADGQPVADAPVADSRNIDEEGVVFHFKK